MKGVLNAMEIKDDEVVKVQGVWLDIAKIKL